MQRHDREGRRLQSHGLQEPELQDGLLLGVPGAVGAARELLVQLQPLRRGRGEGSEGRAGAIAVCPAAVPLLLQQIHEPHGLAQVRAQTVRVGQREDGGDAATQHELDRGAVSQESRRYTVPVQTDADVHLRVRVLSAEEQSVCDL